MSTIRLARLEAYAFRVPITNPIKVAFGTFRDRPMVLVRAVEPGQARPPRHPGVPRLGDRVRRYSGRGMCTDA